MLTSAFQSEVPRLPKYSFTEAAFPSAKDTSFGSTGTGMPRIVSTAGTEPHLVTEPSDVPDSSKSS